MIRRPPRSTRTDTLFPYTTRFRSHIRGGDDLGQQWYHDGKLEKRTNTFTDFIDVAKGLIAGGWTAKGRIAIAGRSAGGELMGAVVNSDPDLGGPVIADVPFVDVPNPMLAPRSAERSEGTGCVGTCISRGSPVN